MRRTKTLKLQKPEPGDVYSSATITANTELIDRKLANIGGNVAVVEMEIAKAVSLRTSDFSYHTSPGTFKVFGNGLVYLEVNVTNKKAIDVNDLGMMGVAVNGASSTANVTVADIKPEYAPAIATPLWSGGLGPAIHGYVAPDSPRVVARLLYGYYSGTIPAGTILQLTGIYPLSEVPRTVSLEQMNKVFDNALHVRNLTKIDSVAAKVKSKNKYYYSQGMDRIGSVNLEDVSLIRTNSGLVELRMRFNNLSVSANTTGDISNTDIATIKEASLFPQTNVKLVSSDTGRVIQGEISRGGVVSVGSYAGRVAIPRTESLTLVGSWMPVG